MQLDRYTLLFDNNNERFEFVSGGNKGKVQKLILFQVISLEAQLYNLAFGDKDETSEEIDDTVVTNNGDTEKVLATIERAADYFFEKHPNAVLYAEGSSKSRTRLYQMSINKNLVIAQKRYIITGKVYDKWELFKTGVIYEAFLVRKKM